MKRKIPLILLCLLFLGIAGYAGTQLYMNWRVYQEGEQAYAELTQFVQIASSPPTVPDTTVPDTTEPEVISDADVESTEPLPTEVADDTVWPEVDFEALWEINPDVVAWIYIEGTNINYPVVQGNDNRYYLKHLIDGTYNRAGAIFLDYRNQDDLSDRNSIFYGHHMNNGTMFKQITKYKNQSFYNKHPVCLIMTPNGNYKLEFFSGYVIDMNSQAWKLEFASDEEYADWLNDTISKSLFTSKVVPTAEDRVITLSTCTYEYNDARFVLVGVLKV